MRNTLFSSGTAGSPGSEFIEQNFQWTSSEELMGIQYIDLPFVQNWPTVDKVEPVELVVLDGEAYEIKKDTPQLNNPFSKKDRFLNSE